MENKLKHREFFETIRNQLTSEELSDYNSLKGKYVIGLLVSVLTFPTSSALCDRITTYNKAHKVFITLVVFAFPPVMINRFLRVHYMEPYFERIYNKYHPGEVLSSA